ncbi:MAG: polysaccharide deacetylase [Eubacteriales bacterium]|nr:polysaccharide deacetylase [Eubacteriales bacterium]
MREMKPDIDEPKKKRKDGDSGELDLPLGELDAIEPEQAEADSTEDDLDENPSEDGEDKAPEELTDDNEEITQEEIEEEKAYEARRAARAERNRIRKLKRRRKRMLVMSLSAAAVIVLAAGIYFGDEFKNRVQDMQKTLAENLNERREKAEMEAASAKADAQKKEEVTKEPEKTADQEQKEAEDRLIRRARRYGKQYDYDRAIKIFTDSELYEKSERLHKYVEKYKKKKASCVAWPIEEVTHVFYHSLIVDPSKAFDGDYKTDGFNQVMTTIDEFNKITQAMYDKGYVMVSIKDMASVDENGNMVPGEILLPPGKIPFVLSQDDVCYYHFMDNNGFATKLVVDEDGKVRNEYINDDGSVSVGDYDMVPLIDRFVEEHPDFSYRGAKGIIALTGYNGILGYRTDSSYETRPDDLDRDKVEWLDAHPEFNLETEREGAKKVAEAMKKNGWLFASHTWGHLNVGEISMERLQRDTQKFKENVDPVIGGTDIIIFAFGADLNQAEDYSGEKFEFLKGQGYNYFCNVDSQKYFVQLRDRYLRMGRRNLDGYRMYYNPEMLDDLFDAAAVFDPTRPVPVAPMG